MVTFLWPDALWLMVALPVLVGTYVALCRRRNTEYLRYTALSLVREALAASQWIRRHAPPLFFLLGLAAALLAVARPAAVTTVQSEQGTVILAIDVSLSMAATDVAPTRLAAAQAAMVNFVRAQPGNVRIGIVAFGGNAHVVQSPTVKKSDVLAALDRLALQQYTAIGTALIAAVLTLHPMAGIDNGNDIFENGWESAAPRGMLAAFNPVEKSHRRITSPTDFSTAIILVSDGCGTIGVSPVKAAEIAADHGIRVYTVGVGTPYGGTANIEGSPPIHAEFQEEVLREIADITRGEYFHARSAGKLNKIYTQLTKQAVLEKRSTEITVPLTLIGMALLLTASVLSLLWWHRFPSSHPPPAPHTSS
jgi:Ca-activated chloride channel family protein